MRRLVLDDILQASGGKVIRAGKDTFTGLSVDSRSIARGELFVALKGERFDGHDFLGAALKAGAGALVDVPHVADAPGKTLILVQNTLQALQDIAAFLRRKACVPVVGITGTNGKTTTKEMIASVLRQVGTVFKTPGNLNNHIGLPLSLANMSGDEDFIVLEMGSSAPGDIRLLCEIAAPDYAVVTNVGPAHLEGFGSIGAVRDTDLEILSYVPTACANADDTFLMEGISGFDGKIVRYGLAEGADVTASDIVLHERGSAFTLRLPDGVSARASLEIAGRFNIYNALAAASVAHALGVSADRIAQGLASFHGVPMRSEIREFMGALVLSDVYNANPASMEAALEELARLKRDRTIAVLGDMLELGDYSKEAHRKIVSTMSQLDVDVFIAVGKEMKQASAGFSGLVYTAEDAAAARSILRSICGKGDAVLIKGSRGIHMEKVLEDVDDRMQCGRGYAL
jgi:UDP-N-acetylmuramoyl-tripeptide--D-alanyl-D-alanine ligase